MKTTKYINTTCKVVQAIAAIVIAYATWKGLPEVGTKIDGAIKAVANVQLREKAINKFEGNLKSDTSAWEKYELMKKGE